MSNQSPTEMTKLVAERAATRSKIKAAYQIAYNNPFRTEPVFDPAAFRYEAARAYAKEYYKFTPRSLLIPAVLGVTVYLLQKQINKDRAAKEEKIRSGNSSYYERALYSSRFLS